MELLKKPKATVKCSYEFVKSGTYQKTSQTSMVGEDFQMTDLETKRALNTADDLDRNIAEAKAIMDLLVNFSSRFRLSVSTGNRDFDKKVKQLFEYESKAKNFDLAERNSLQESLELFERTKLCHGQSLYIKLANGKMQAIPGNRICYPSDFKNIPKQYKDKINKKGQIIDSKTGKTIGYCINRWADDGKSLIFDHVEPSENVIFSANYRSFDQASGISRFAACIVQLKDLAETHQFTRLKLKLHSILALHVSEDSPLNMGETTEVSSTGNAQLSLDATKVPWIYQSPPGTKIETVESKQPSNEYVEFFANSLRSACNSVGVPYTFVDGRGASFSSRIADNNLFEYMIDGQRNKNKRVLDEWADWKLDYHCTEGGILYKDMVEAGLTIDEVKIAIKYVAVRSPYIDKSKEIKGDNDAMASGQDSLQRICARHGEDWREIADENIESYNYYKENGMPWFLGNPGQLNVIEEDEEETDKPQNQDEDK